ncbi:MAG: noncanonical pyrimidine nucleotidase, YjjG family [Ruminococcaceae bacterium]|nr:noncanonical pyrimidine nucleotidase, YjjG family [Oscillospiraceae bacterium]
MRYTTVLFDADGTLLDFLRSEKESVAQTLSDMGLSPTEEMLTVYSAINDSLWKRLERGEIEKQVLFYHRFELLFAEYGLHADPKETAVRYMTHLSGKGYVLAGAKELCQCLYGAVRLYLVTNGTESIQRGRWANSGLSPYFEDVFISDVIGYEKPDHRYFEYVAAHIPDFRRENTLLVGDSLTSDIPGGIGFGIDTCFYNPKGKSVPAELRERLTYEATDFQQIYETIMQGEGS